MQKSKTAIMLEQIEPYIKDIEIVDATKNVKRGGYIEIAIRVRTNNRHITKRIAHAMGERAATSTDPDTSPEYKSAYPSRHRRRHRRRRNRRRR